MAQVTKIKQIESIPGADRLMVVTLEPFGLQVVVGAGDFLFGEAAVFIPVGTVLPWWLQRLFATNNGVVEPKTFYGIVSQGLLVPFDYLPAEFRVANSADRLIANGFNVGGVLGCVSRYGTAHFGDKVTAEVDNETGEVVSLFSDGQILLMKNGLSQLIGPLAPQAAVMVGHGRNELQERIDAFGDEADFNLTTVEMAIDGFAKSKEHLGSLIDDEDAKLMASGVVAGFRMAANVARAAMVEALELAIGEENADKVGPYLDAHVSVALTNRFREAVSSFEEMITNRPACNCGPGEGCSDCPRDPSRQAAPGTYPAEGSRAA